MYFFYNPRILRWFLRKEVYWSIPVSEKVFFLTFDDGPDPDATPAVLKILDHYDAKATFFCVGENITRHPELFGSIKSQGHGIGNHTFNHLDGWKTRNPVYLQNIRQCNDLTRTFLFRPPHGRLTLRQLSIIREEYKIIMWTSLAGDFDPEVNLGKSLRKLTTHLKSGDIVTFHDNGKFIKNVNYLLPRFLDFAYAKGFTSIRLDNCL